jgi:hypothetical protein
MYRIHVALLLLIWPMMARPASDKPTLMVSIRSLKTTYRIGEKIQLEIQLSNIGQADVLIRRQLGSGVGRTDVQVFDSRHKRVFTEFLADELPPPPTVDDFLRLEPGQFFGESLEAPAKDFVNSPGTYEFVVQYTSTASQEWVGKYLKLPDVPLWSRERGTIASAPIKLAITK